MIVTLIESAVTDIFTFVSPKVISWGLVQVEKREYPKPVTQGRAQGQPYQTQHLIADNQNLYPFLWTVAYLFSYVNESGLGIL
jgi:hypothetical protein